MTNRLVLTLCSVAASSAFVLACSSAKHADGDATAGAQATAGAGGHGGTTGTAGDAPDSGAGQGAHELGGAPAAGSGGSATAGSSSNGGAPSAGADDGGSAGSSTGDAGAGGAGPAPPLLNNSGFELGSLVGWKLVVTPTSAGKSVFAQYPVGDAKAIDGTYEVTFWNGNSAFTGALEQTVTDLSPGKYQLKVYVAFGTGLNAAYLYAINCGLSNLRVDLPIVDMVPTLTQFTVPDIDVTGSSCTVGLFADMDTGDWLNADAFLFEPAPAG